ncbi:MAG: ribonuclease HII [Proteobacteria bacterium]|nr:ribonuclease HII [Pseudomonadota bacterium]
MSGNYEARQRASRNSGKISKSHAMGKDLWIYEKNAMDQGYVRIAGVDEAGRGPLAGPVVSAAVILPEFIAISREVDSKKLTHGKRETLYQTIYENAVSIGIGIVDHREIDRVNILNASLFSMAMAVENLCPQPDYLIIDGIFQIQHGLPQRPVPKGDSLSMSIGCASIIAKVTRDRLMERHHQDDPRYGFNRHKGYPTREHKAAIAEHGCSFIHRKSFKGVKEYEHFLS